MRNHARTLALCTLTAALLAAPSAARAQEPVGAPPAGETAAHRGRAVSGSGGGLGVGAAAFISGLAGPQVVYDFGAFHAEGLFGFDHRDAGAAATSNAFAFGLSGWYHLHAGDRSDFSIGGGIGFLHQKNSNGAANDATVFEPGAQVRVFITDNVAVHGRLGLDFVFGDDTAAPDADHTLGSSGPHLGLAGQLASGFGFTYYFR
jgi:hypothetical protein